MSFELTMSPKGFEVFRDMKAATLSAVTRINTKVGSNLSWGTDYKGIL